MSPIVGIILLLAIEIAGGLAIVHHERCSDTFGTIYDTGDCPPTQSELDDQRTRCACEPPTNPDGSPCRDITLPNRAGIAWRCHVKPALMHGEAPQ